MGFGESPGFSLILSYNSQVNGEFDSYEAVAFLDDHENNAVFSALDISGMDNATWYESLVITFGKE